MAGNRQATWGFMIAWEFRPKRGAEEQFERAYGPDGLWARFFAQGEGFIATQLNRDLNDATRYLTLDLWVSREAYERFRAAHSGEYEAIDAQCVALTEHEKELGCFERLGS